MKHYLGCLVAALAISALAAVPLVDARQGGMSPGGGFSRGDRGGFGAWRGSGDRGRFGHDRFHDHFGFSFFWPGPYWYPYYWAPYYYNDYYDYYRYPPAYPYDYYPPPYRYDYRPTYDYRGGAPSSADYDGRDYLMLGHDAGKALKLKTVTRDWLVEYLRAYVINAPPGARDDFRRGFISGYGEDGETIFKRATQEAEEPNPPPVPRRLYQNRPRPTNDSDGGNSFAILQATG